MSSTMLYAVVTNEHHMLGGFLHPTIPMFHFQIGETSKVGFILPMPRKKLSQTIISSPKAAFNPGSNIAN